MVQTRFTNHHAMTAFAKGDHSLFLGPELMFRRTLRYPPYTQLVRLDVSGTLEPMVSQAAHRWAGLLRTEIARVTGQRSDDNRWPVLGAASVPGKEDMTTILGPSPAPHARLRGRHHWQILLKGISQETTTTIALRTIEVLERGPRPGALRFDIDVDPIAMG
jgi:primosomal protein N' (replication factor Y)